MREYTGYKLFSGIKELLIKYQEHLFPFFDILLNVGNYYFHIFTSKFLIPKNYGVLNSLLAILAILFVTGISFQVFMAKEVALGNKRIINPVDIISTAFIYFVFIFISYFLFVHNLIKFTRSDFLLLFILFLIFILNLMVSLIRGIFQGEKRFIQLNFSFYIEVGFKLIFLFIFLPYFENLMVILFSLLFGTTLSLIHGLIKTKDFMANIKFKWSKKSIKKAFKLSLIIFISNFFIYFFTSIDMLVVNYRFPSVSGEFAVVLKFSSILLFVVFSCITVFLPNLSKVMNEKKIFLKRVFKYLILIMIIELLSMIGYFYLFPIVLPYIFSNAYIGAKDYIFFGGLVYTLLVNIFYMVNVNIVLNRKDHFIYLAIGGVFLTFYIYFYSTGIMDILRAQFIIYLLIFSLLIIDFLVRGIGYEKNKEIQ